jgi:hypothetical protein
MCLKHLLKKKKRKDLSINDDLISIKIEKVISIKYFYTSYCYCKGGMKMDEINEIKNRFFSRMLNDFSEYFNLYEYLKFKVKEKYHHNTITIENENEFWNSVLDDQYYGKEPENKFNIENGQIVKLNNMYLSEWAPKRPGMIWTEEGAKQIKKGKEKIDKIMKVNNKIFGVLDPYNKKKVLAGGYGSIRLNTGIIDNESYAYLNAITLDNWFCDSGIPIVVSKSAYGKFKNYSKNNTAPEIEKLEGIVVKGNRLPWINSIPSALGSKIPTELADMLTQAPLLPKVFIYVPSRKNIELKYNNSHPDCIAWTLFEADYEPNYGYTYIGFNPIEKDSIKEAVDFINGYVEDYRGTKIITDFDGIEPKLKSEINIDKNPKSNFSYKRKYKSINKSILRKNKFLVEK